jgi:hypothetical protein
MTSRRRKGIRERWLLAVATADLDCEARTLLHVLYAYMSDAGYVSIPRDALAELFGCDPRRITERMARARKAGLITRRGGGYKGRAAEYEALIPTSKGASRAHSLEHPFWQRVRQDCTLSMPALTHPLASDSPAFDTSKGASPTHPTARVTPETVQRDAPSGNGRRLAPATTRYIYVADDPAFVDIA